MKEIVILAGPNGAGKTTAAVRFLPRLPYIQEFLNADEFARALCPTDPDSAAFAAGRRLLDRMRELIASEHSFGIETTLSGKSYLPLLRKCKSGGWRITLLFLWLPTPQAAIRRVERRVRGGGHGIPSETVRRRYFAGIANMLKYYLPLADEVEIYDNSVKLVQIATRSEGGAIFVRDLERWGKLTGAFRWNQ